MIELIRCPYCDSDLVMHWQNPRFDRCSKCGMILRNPFPNELDLRRLYENSWKEPEENPHETGGAVINLADQYVSQLIAIVGIVSIQGRNILDFGAGRGMLMEELSRNGALVCGVEPYGCQYLLDLGFDAVNSLGEIPETRKFDGIVTIDVVEHLREPWAEIDVLFERLVPGGWLCIATPNPYGLNARISKNSWRELKRPGHILFLSDQTLKYNLPFNPRHFVIQKD